MHHVVVNRLVSRPHRSHSRVKQIRVHHVLANRLRNDSRQRRQTQPPTIDLNSRAQLSHEQNVDQHTSRQRYQTAPTSWAQHRHELAPLAVNTGPLLGFDHDARNQLIIDSYTAVSRRAGYPRHLPPNLPNSGRFTWIGSTNVPGFFVVANQVGTVSLVEYRNRVIYTYSRRRRYDTNVSDVHVLECSHPGCNRRIVVVIYGNDLETINFAMKNHNH